MSSRNEPRCPVCKIRTDTHRCCAECHQKRVAALLREFTPRTEGDERDPSELTEAERAALARRPVIHETPAWCSHRPGESGRRVLKLNKSLQ